MSESGAQVANENPEVEETPEGEATETETPAATKTAEEPSDSGSALEAASKEELLKEVQKLRKENAAKRTKAKQTEEAAKKWQEHVDSQKTEMEKLQDEKKRLDEELSAYRLEKTQNELAEKHGVDPDLAEFIVGSDLDEMTEKAKKLAEKSNKKTTETVDPTAKDFRAGNAGAEAKGKTSEWFTGLFN